LEGYNHTGESVSLSSNYQAVRVFLEVFDREFQGLLQLKLRVPEEEVGIPKHSDC